MSRKDLENRVCQILKMKGEGDTADSIEAGEFQPSDCPEVVKEISALRVRQIKQLSQINFQFHETRQAVQEMEYHTYQDFILSLQHGTPTRTQGIQAGHSLGSYSANLAGYMAYLGKKDSELTRFFFSRLKARIPEGERKRHTYILGKSGSGKSEFLKVLIYAYMRKPDYCTTVLIDPHGDLAEEVARFKEFKTADSLVYIDPFLDGDGQHFPILNPFDIRDQSRQNIDIVSQNLLSAFKEILSNTSLTVQMEALLIPCLSVLLTRKGSTLFDLQRFMNDERNSDLLKQGKASKNIAHSTFFRDRFQEKTFDATKASISTKLQSLLNSEVFYQLTVGKSTIDIEQLLNSKKIVVFNLSKGQLGSDTSSAFGRFVLALSQASVMKRAQMKKSDRIPVHMFIDEFQNYISPSIEEVLAESRKYGLHLTFAQQFLGQKMDTNFKRAILANTQVKMIGMSANDSRSAISKEIGVDESEIARLGVGMFYTKVGNKPAFKLYAPTFLLGNKNAMTWEEWEGVKAHQLSKYYHYIGKDGAPDTQDQRGADMREYRPEKEAPEIEPEKEVIETPDPSLEQPKYDL